VKPRLFKALAKALPIAILYGSSFLMKNSIVTGLGVVEFGGM